MSTPSTPRTRRGADAVQAAIDAFEVAERTDLPDRAGAEPRDLDLDWVRDRIATARRATDAEAVTADEALSWLAYTIDEERPVEDVDQDAAPDR